jgi:hypothetical protein
MGTGYSFEKAVDSGNIAAIAGMFIGGPPTMPDYTGLGSNAGVYGSGSQGPFIFSLAEASQSASGLDQVEYFLAGLSDSLSFGWTARTRESRGLILPPCGGAYEIGQWTPVTLGGLRLAYAGAAKTISAIVGGGTECALLMR